MQARSLRRSLQVAFSFLASLIGVLFAVSLPCASHAGSTPHVSGAWFDPARAGAGFLLEELTDGRVIVYWFTYDASGAQQWFVGDARLEAGEVRVDPLYRPIGARFGDAFSEDDVRLEEVGSLAFAFDGCNRATASFSVDGAVGEQDLSRLTAFADDDCAPGGLAAGNEFSASGSWYTPGRSGEGLIVQTLDEDEAFVAWFTYDEVGRQRWLVGSGQVAERFVHVGELLLPTGGRLDDGHDPDAVVRASWGRLEIEMGCGAGRYWYEVTGATGGATGERQLDRLTTPVGVRCQDDALGQATASGLVGRWDAPDFGMAADITAAGFRVIQYTAESCLTVLEGGVQELMAAARSEILLSESGQRARFTGLDSISPVEFRRTGSLPPACGRGDSGFSPTPERTLAAFGALFDERYAAFDLRGVDWSRQVATHGRGPVADDRALLDRLIAMVDPLDDGHVIVQSPQGVFNAGSNNAARQLHARANAASVDRLIYDVYLGGQREVAANRAVSYGLLGDGTAYLELRRLTSMYPALETTEGLLAFDDELDTIFRWIDDQGSAHLVIDLRRNTGGDAKFGLRLAQRFLDRRQLVFHERRRQAESLGPTIATALDPTSRPGFSGAVTVLLSPLTASAAEITAMAIAGAADARIVGEPSEGVLSRSERILPNGWLTTVTPGRVFAPNGAWFEKDGIAVDQQVRSFELSDIGAGVDPALDAALQR